MEPQTNQLNSIEYTIKQLNTQIKRLETRRRELELLRDENFKEVKE